MRILRSALLAVSSLLVEQAAAQELPLPTGNVTIIVPFPPGGPVDVQSRLFADRLGQRTKRTFVVENRPGAAGNIGSAAVARAAPDGRTWLYTVDNVLTINPHVYPRMGFDPDKELVHIGQMGQVILMLAINAKVPIKTLTELQHYSRTKSLNFGSAGNGSPGHLAFEYLKQVSKLQGAHVPFRGSQQVQTELIAGNVEGAFIVAAALVDFVQSGHLRALAVSDSRRLPSFPDVPTAAEAGIPDFEARFSFVMSVPARTPQPVHQFIEQEMRELLKDAEMRKRFAALGSEPLVSDAAETKMWIEKERRRWGAVIQAAGIKVPDAAESK